MDIQAFQLPPAANLPTEVKDVLPALTVMLINGALDFLAAVLILIAGWTVASWLSRWLRQAMAGLRIDPTLKPLIANMVRYTILGITIVAMMGQFGIQTTSLIALVGAAGLAVGLALQGTLSNVASGVLLLILRPFRAEDRIKVNDVTGKAEEIGLFRTILTTDDGIYVSIPNASIFTSTITNFTRRRWRRADFTLEIDHNEDIAAAQKLVMQVLADDPKVLEAPAPVVEVAALNGIATTLSVQAWLANKDFGPAASELRRKIRQALNEAGMRPPVPLVAAPTQTAQRPAADSPAPQG